MTPTQTNLQVIRDLQRIEQYAQQEQQYVELSSDAGMKDWASTSQNTRVWGSDVFNSGLDPSQLQSSKHFRVSQVLGMHTTSIFRYFIPPIFQST